MERGFGYVISSKRFTNRLRREAQNLANEVQRVGALEEQARSNVREFNVVFMSWKRSADEGLAEARDLLDDFEKAPKTCCYGTLPDPKSRYRFSGKAEEKIEIIKQLTQNCIRFRALDDICFIDSASGNVAALTSAGREGKGVVRPIAATASTSSASTSTKLGDDGVFESRALITQNIMDALANNSNSVVGVHGMGGVGKSTLLVDVERRIKKEKLFDLVAKATVSVNPDIKTIQGDIADALGLTDIKNKETIEARAKLLHRRLKEEEGKNKKVLIILDNLWKCLNLESVGIPCRYDNKVVGCKLLLTSRDRDVLQTEMGCDKDFPLGELKEEEAKRLFEELVGDKVHDDDFKPLVDKALLKCAGFPFLIVNMAKYFRHASLSEWEIALNQIKLSKNKRFGEAINNMLQLSYDHLKDAEKSLLALCVAYGTSKPSFENLVRYGVGLRLFQEADNMEEARESLRLGIRTLQASSLLLEDGDTYGFKIHDLVHEFVASVSSRDHPILVLKDKDKSITELPKDKLKSCRALCLPYVDMQELPQELDCSELRIFLLFTNNRSLKVPFSLFHSMRKLTVLNLSGICLTCSSSSPFQFLENLHTLCLDGCSLDNVAILGELKGLHILSFVNCNIYRLPREIGQLTELKLLDLNHCLKLEIIEPSVLQSLIKLEELYMQNSFAQWNTMEQTPPTNASLIELNHMKNLRTLHVSIPNLSVLPEDLNVENLTKYEIRIGNAWGWSRKFKGSKTLELKSDPLGNILHKGCIQSILGKTDNLLLEQLHRNEQSICVLSQKGFPELKHLQVKNSPSIHYILQSPSHIHFKMLESLFLKNLINLEMICHSHISSKSFSTLKVVKVNSCDKMEVLFPLSVVRELPRLEEIKVVGCKLIRTIIEADDCHKFELHNLHVLKLRDLPNIKNFFNVRSTLSSSTSDDHVSTQIAFFNGRQVSIPSLESLTMEGLPNLKEIWSDESPLELSNLQSLIVVQCESLLTVISSESLSKLDKLHTLIIRDCVSVQEIFDLDGQSGSGNVETLSQLTILKLSNMRSLRCIWNKNPRGIVSFHILKELEVDECNNLRFIFFPSMVKSLAQVRDLRVEDCKKMEAIIMEEEGFGMETSETLALPMLTNLNLKYLESLKCFSHRKCSLEAPSQDRVQSHSPTLFNREVAFPSLETLDIKAMNIEKIWDNQVAVDSFHNLKSLCVDGCNKLANLVPSCILGQLLSLESLEATKCGALEVVFKLQPPNTPDGHIIALPLKELTVSSLPKLKCLWDKELHHQVKFQRLHSISIFRCKNLTSLFPVSVAKDLTQLEELEIDECGIVELIEKEEGLVPEIVFPKLISLKLEDLRELKCIYTGKHISYWPALKTLKVNGCYKVEILASHPKNEMPLDKQALFLIEKVAFPSLEALNIASLDNIEMIWDNQVAANSFPKLKSLRVDRCNKLVNIVCSFILRRLLSLERLDARRCGSLEVVFELQPLNHLDRNPIALPLKELTVSELPKLKCVWDKELHCQVKFQGLRSISVSRCESLASLFPTSVAKDLMQLEELKIDECGIAEIIEKEDGLVPRFVFAKLTSLELNYLGELKCLYVGTHTSHWPVLKSLKVHGCDKVEILASHLENEMPIDKQALFLIEKGAFPNLQELKLDLSERMEIWHGHFHDGEFFCKLSLLKLCHLSQDSSISTCCFIESLTNLEELVVCESYREDPSINEEAIEGRSHEMKVILPFPRYIRHLQTLDVSHCDGLSKMFTPTIAENLVALTKLRISNCRILTEVINDEKGGDGRVVAFNQLKYMELDGLIGLRSFSLGGYTLMFPLLEDIIVTRCPNMKFFSQGPMEASKLKRIQVSRKAWFWAGNLNITIQNMFEEMGTFVGVEKMLLSEFPGLIGKWHNGLNPIKSCWQLKSMVVDKCPSFINAIPSRLMLVLDNLSFLQVRDCKLLEEIFDLEGLEAVESTQVLPKLQELNLANLPKLRQLWNKDLQESIRFDSLTTLILYNCSNLGHAFTSSMAQCLANLEWMEIKECGQMEEVIVEEEGHGSAVEKITFPKLWWMKLECLPNLTCFLSRKNHTLECPKLSILSITHCPKMRSLTGQSRMENDHGTPAFFTSQVQFPQLMQMDLSHMDNLSKIWTDGPLETLTFDCLWKVKVLNCKSLENLFPYWVATSLTQLEKLKVKSCEIEEIVASGDDTPRSNTTQDLFPKLTSLVLHDMPRLKSFCPNLPLNLPLLEELRVTHCEKLSMLSFVASMNKWAQRDDQQDLSIKKHTLHLRGTFPTWRDFY
ncbi:uncharacterized protein LOC104452789 [Eucalyptus grandis]|uniref:uncharacterized protein LOC104452789 n=1 Tax=Eucalyptus grandis TaxID=71139 RepID=UPI00192E7CE6|nr:uncharacterized protein LOC104452789 [Eucalyptus grandis]XP_039160675.1 uncharacterized protein LOC104452789 [Eucalyptus grandis]XP_039160676.1 uncharacterized protein LOC104452789 [Eucalyptus grandis]XP_039160677.1 uncharacterized protein LOC104452789 [Eucalyptus grandis]XP_039160678.1 uncharacterized protein LOC104452789 [Eucalyptus grandis]XP_039160679.1 uncharacterized protein LOC104452789 [Eucalyptus grandis]XP_039160680.1 uncharacterized protein LOC104452789 [Eucalyptus grandis]XP_0